MRFPTLDLTPTAANLSQLIYRSIKTIVIRDEYELAYNAIVEAITSKIKPRVIFLFTGQPGTGLQTCRTIDTVTNQTR